MKAILIKYNDKVIAVEQLSDLTTKQFLDLKKEAKKTVEEKDNRILALENHISELYENLEETNAKIDNLQHQINVITGIEEESEVKE